MHSVSPEPRTFTQSFRRILSLGYPHRNGIFLAVVLATLASGLALIIPMALSQVLDDVLAEGTRALINRMALLLMVILITQACLRFGAHYLAACNGERIIADFRKRIYAHLHTLSLRFFNTSHVGELISRLGHDVVAMRRIITEFISEVLITAITIIGSIALLININWRLSLVIFLTLPVATFITKRFGNTLRNRAEDVQEHLAQTNVRAEQSMSLYRLVKEFGRSGFEIRRYNKSVESLFNSSRRHALFTAIYVALIELVFFVPLVVTFWYGSLEMMAGRLTAGHLVAAYFYMMNISLGAETLSAMISALVGAVGASDRVFTLLDEQPEIVDSPEAISMPPVSGRIRFDNVSFHYDPQTPILHRVSFEIKPGQRIALIGPSGAGKTTIINLLFRFFDPVSGTIALDHHDIRSVTLDSLRSQIALVSQDVQLFNDTILENIRYGRLDASDEEVYRVAKAACVDTFVEPLPDGYQTMMGERGVLFSGGQRQRISIARAMLKNTPILLLDEAMSSLDVETEVAVKTAMETLMQNRTCLIITHRLSSISDVDQILILDNRRIRRPDPATVTSSRPASFSILKGSALSRTTKASLCPAVFMGAKPEYEL